MNRKALTIIVTALLAFGLQAQNPPDQGISGMDALTKNEIMKEKDPAGLVLTAVSVPIVFISLLLLAIIFGYIGKAQHRSFKQGNAGKAKNMTPEEAAAIAMALDQEYGTEVCAAIAMALDSCLSDDVHDKESFILTIKPSEHSQWNDKRQGFRRLPRE